MALADRSAGTQVSRQSAGPISICPTGRPLRIAPSVAECLCASPGSYVKSWTWAGSGKRRQRLRQTEKEAAPRTILRCTDTDAGAIADLIFLVEDIDHVKARRERADAGNREIMCHAGVDLGVIRQALAI